MVCGADLVTRSGGWHQPVDPPRLVISRPKTPLPRDEPADGWQVVPGQTTDLSSTLIREWMRAGDWDRLEKSEAVPPELLEFLAVLHRQGKLGTRLAASALIPSLV